MLVQDDVPNSIRLYSSARGENERSLSPPVELTSRVSQTEIKEMLEELSTAHGVILDAFRGHFTQEALEIFSK